MDKHNLRFGVEIELNSLDDRDFTQRPLARGELPDGTNHVVALISGLGLDAELQGWKYNHNNTVWVCKPDASCGVEVCSPVFSQSCCGDLLRVMEALRADPDIKADDRCSFHVHIDVSDIAGTNSSELASVLAWWIKCEHVFMDSFPSSRKGNQYCKCIGLTSLFDDAESVAPCRVISKLSDKYLTLNTFHLYNRRRKTVEFRLCEGTKDPNLALSWVTMVLHFVHRCLNSELPEDYKWMSVSEVFDFLNLDSDLKNWFVGRIAANLKTERRGFWSNLSREHAIQEYKKICPMFFGQIPLFIDNAWDK